MTTSIQLPLTSADTPSASKLAFTTSNPKPNSFDNAYKPQFPICYSLMFFSMPHSMTPYYLTPGILPFYPTSKLHPLLFTAIYFALSIPLHLPQTHLHGPSFISPLPWVDLVFMIFRYMPLPPLLFPFSNQLQWHPKAFLSLLTTPSYPHSLPTPSPPGPFLLTFPSFKHYPNLVLPSLLPIQQSQHPLQPSMISSTSITLVHSNVIFVVTTKKHSSSPTNTHSLTSP